MFTSIRYCKRPPGVEGQNCFVMRWLESENGCTIRKEPRVCVCVCLLVCEVFSSLRSL